MLSHLESQERLPGTRRSTEDDALMVGNQAYVTFQQESGNQALEGKKLQGLFSASYNSLLVIYCNRWLLIVRSHL